MRLRAHGRRGEGGGASLACPSPDWAAAATASRSFRVEGWNLSLSLHMQATVASFQRFLVFHVAQDETIHEKH